MTVKERFKRIYERFALTQLFNLKNVFGGTAGSHERLQAIYNGLKGKKDNDKIKAIAEALKHEAGISGSATWANNVRFWISRDAKGLELQVGNCKPQNGAYNHTYEFKYTWQQTAKIVLERGLLK